MTNRHPRIQKANGHVILKTARAVPGSLAFPVAAQVKLAGTVSEWYGGTPTQSPKKRALAGVTVVAGADLNYNTGQSGADRIQGKVAAKAITDAKGSYSLNLPAGRYTAPANHSVEISPDKGMQGLHRSLDFAAR